MAASPNFTAPPSSNSPLLNLDQVEDLLKLQKAAQKISSILDLDQLVDKVVNEVARSFGCLDSDIYLHNQERGELSLACAHGCTGCELHGPGHSLKIGKGMVGYVASTGQMHYAPDVRQDPYYIGCEESTLSGSCDSPPCRRAVGGSIHRLPQRTGCLQPLPVAAASSHVQRCGSGRPQRPPISTGTTAKGANEW